MLIKFTCKTSPDISMFEDAAKRMLALMHQSGKIPGALRPEDVASALNALQQGLKAGESNSEEEEDISMNTRAYPLVQLLKHAVTEKEYVTWDYDNHLI